MPKLARPTDEGYWVKKSSAACFADCCNEFWWISTNVAKGLWREEILYAYENLNSVREMLSGKRKRLNEDTKNKLDKWIERQEVVNLL